MTRDALETLGTIITADETRDAVHIACLPAVANSPMRPGQHVTYSCGIADKAFQDSGGVGIVDPFLPGTVETGQRFWIFLYPRSITGLRHRWTHPEIPDNSDDVDEHRTTVEQSNFSKTARTAWDTIERWAEKIDCAPQELVEAATYHQNTGDIYEFSHDINGAIVEPDFWAAWSEITGKPVTHESDSFYRCTC